MPFPIVADPERIAYAAFDLQRTTWLRLMKPRVIWGYLKFIVAGAMPHWIPKGEDALQLGGDFLVAPDRRRLWVHRGVDPLDRPTVDELLEVCTKLCHA